jgi:hypothetical protein
MKRQDLASVGRNNSATIEALRPLIEPETPWNTFRDVVTIEINVEVWNALNQLWGALHADLRLGWLEADHCHPSTNEENGDEEARREVLADARRELGVAN